MENASKALLIAGAILICILLIGVGMMVYQGAQGGINEAILQMSQQEKEMFNQNFTRYEGTRVTGTNVRALVGNIISSNNANAEIEGKLVSIAGDKTFTVTSDALLADDISAYRASINTGATYQVTMGYDASGSGLVTTVTITRNT